MSSVVRDLRHALRQLRQHPLFAALAILTLGLALGAAAAILTVVYGVLLKPLAYPDSGRLVAIYTQAPGLGVDRFWVSPAEYIQLRGMAQSYESLGAYTTGIVSLIGVDGPLRAHAAEVSVSLLTTLRARPARGRLFVAADEVPGSELRVVLGYGLWRRAFGGDPGVVGKPLRLEGMEVTVIGIMEPGLDLDDDGVEVWLPLILGPITPRSRAQHYLNVIGRLKEPVGLEQAKAEMQQLLTRWPRSNPQDHVPDPVHHRLIVQSLLDSEVGAARPGIRLLALAVACLLLIACANVANLLLARSEARRLEMGVRGALGARPGRLAGQLLTESLLLTFLAAAVGLLFAFWGLKSVLAVNPDGVPRAAQLGPDPWVLLALLVLALVTGCLFGVAPILHSRSAGVASLLREGRASSTPTRKRLRRGLVVLEVALATVLLIAAGLLVRSLLALEDIDAGFRPQGVLTLALSLPQATYREPHKIVDLYDQLVDRVSALPGVAAAAVVSGLPPRRRVDANGTLFENIDQGPDGPPENVDFWQFVSPGYFPVMGIKLVAGRFFSSQDSAGAPGVVMVNETLARTYWPGQDPIGKRLRSPRDGSPWLTVVGVVGDVKQNGLDQPTGTEVYFPFAQAPDSVGYVRWASYLVLRAEGSDPLSLAGPVRDIIRDLDPSLPIGRVAPMTTVVADSLARRRFIALLVGLFAVVSLLLAVAGTYGVLAYSVERRAHEIGLRVALGATSLRVRKQEVGEGLPLVGLGLVVGLGLALFLGRLLSSLLYGVSAFDAPVWIAVVATLALTGWLACYVPAVRASRANPIDVLRQE